MGISAVWRTVVFKMETFIKCSLRCLPSLPSGAFVELITIMNCIRNCQYEIIFELVTNSYILLLSRILNLPFVLVKEAFFKDGEKESRRILCKSIELLCF